jgi:hypothetical protein
MSNALVSSVVNALSFRTVKAGATMRAGGGERHPYEFSPREWERHIGVLDRSGLTLPFYARMLATGDYGRFPLRAIAAFERRRSDNQYRMQCMLKTFGEAVCVLQKAGVQFLCVKGFSLFPEFLEEPWQRHQIDFDLLIAPGDGSRAQTALEELGYKLTAVAGDDERRMRIPVRQVLSHDAYLYDPQEGGAIELHSRFWEAGAEEFPLTCPEDAFEQAEMHTLDFVSFLRLSQPHAFLYQVLHVFRHFLGSWARPLWLYEIASYMERHGDDIELWREVAALLSADARITEAASLVLLTAKELFACQIPSALEKACTLPDDDPIRLWVHLYARRWILADMPGNKLNLLLQRRFFSDGRIWRRYLAGRLAPRGARPVLCEGIDTRVAKSLRYRSANLRYKASRAWHHLRTGAGFAAASVAWGIHLRPSHAACSPHGLNRGES